MHAEAIRKILVAGNQAPSGDNSQPWYFVVKGNTVDIFIDGIARERRPLLDYAHRPTYLAHGALIENISIAADHFGYYADITLLPDPSNFTHTAHIEFREDLVDHNVMLFEWISKRITNRKKYRRKNLSEVQKQELKDAPALTGSAHEIRFIEDRATIEGLARSASLYERLLFSHRQLHRNFYDILRWTKREAQEKRNGLYIETLELSVLERLLLRYVLRFWTAVRILRLFGVHLYAACKGRARYRRAGAYVAIVGESLHEEDFIRAGRVMERMWLIASRSGLCVHPTYAIMLLSAPVIGGVDVGYTQRQETLLLDAAANMRKAFNVESGRHLLFLFRIGEGALPREHALRREPKIFFE